MSPSLIVLAAGLGSRFGSSKQLEPLDGLNKTIMELSILDAHLAGVEHCILVINQAIKADVERLVLPRLPKGISVDLAVQSITDVPKQFAGLAQARTKPWGTGQALLAAKPFFKEKAIVITADDFYGRHAFKQLVSHIAQSDDWSMLAYPITHTLSQSGGVNRGLCQVDQFGYLERVTECLNITQTPLGLVGELPEGSGGQPVNVDQTALASMTIWGIDSLLMERLADNFSHFLSYYDSAVGGEFFLPDQIQLVIDKKLKQVRVLTAQDSWLGITYRSDLAQVSAQLQKLYKNIKE
ncbi:NTP transferase domain-containing protein [Psychrobium sp. 1_MG-2023]|uniref:NTP transferase domain-containing protein n=1 Tax=Psychrobium sp. 1_MG-2023 TaxID=3062624 RepID=UPI0026D05C31|nr:NTP transferase domain-containing protein [Psychrobium sp. 1_MG-2023]MDP2560614.1 NTP transferase domain-containing protein [Psychrobium sp. 1_MG-2023]